MVVGLDLLVRPLEEADLPAVAKMAGALVRLHHQWDAGRFLLIGDPESGYARYFRSILGDRATVLLVAERDGDLVGYVYAALEPRDWNALLDAAGTIHDIFTVEGARRTGVAGKLLDAAVAELRARGAKRFVAHVATPNEASRRLFARLGFRETMVEVFRDE